MSRNPLNRDRDLSFCQPDSTLCVLTSVSHGQSLHNQSWVSCLTLSDVTRVCRAEVEVVGDGAATRGEGTKQRWAPVQPRALRMISSCERKVRGVLGLACGRRAVPLPCLSVSYITPISTSPLPQSASDGVCDVS